MFGLPFYFSGISLHQPSLLLVGRVSTYSYTRTRVFNRLHLKDAFSGDSPVQEVRQVFL